MAKVRRSAPGRTRDEVFIPGKMPAKGRALSPARNSPALRDGMQVLLSLVLMGAAILIVLSHAYDAQEKHWAYGTLGTILGFWLKGSK
jgi:hypothetical protein